MIVKIHKQAGGKFTVILQSRRVGFPRLRIDQGVTMVTLKDVLSQGVREMRRPVQLVLPEGPLLGT